MQKYDFEPGLHMPWYSLLFEKGTKFLLNKLLYFNEIYDYLRIHITKL